MPQFTPEQLAEMETELAQIHAERDERRRKMDEIREVVPIAFFEPNPWQYRAIVDIATKVKPEVQNTIGHFPGNSGGKTFLIPAMFWNIAAGPQNKWFEYPLFRDWPFPKHFRVIGKKQLFFEGTGEFWKAIHTWWPKVNGEPYGWSFEKGDYHYPSQYKLPNGFCLDCITPDIEEHEGVELGFLALLEPEEEAIWNQYVRAFRRGGLKLLSCTMARCSEWMDRRILQNPDAIITPGHPMDNCDETVMDTPLGEVRGKLSRASLESIRDNLPEEEVATRWDGQPIYWRGRVLHNAWDEHVHIVDDDLCPRLVMHKINIDPHPGKPWCILVGGIAEDGGVWIIDEWPTYDTFGRFYSDVPYDAPEHGEKFYFDLINRFRENKYRRNIPILDYKMGRTPDRTDSGTSSLLDRMERACHCQFDRQNCNVGGVDGSGLTLLKTVLAWDKSKPISEDNHPMLHVLRRCKNTTHQMLNLTWKKSAELGKFGTSEVFDPRFFDFPRGVMSILSHEGGVSRRRITTPEEDAAARRSKVWAEEMKLMSPHHPEWRRRPVYA